MSPSLACVSLLVRDYDPAIAFFTGALGFRLVSDEDMGEGRRWVVVAPTGRPGAALLLAKAKNEGEAAAVGRQCAGRVFLFLETDNFARDHALFASRGVRFLEEPRRETYGRVAVFEDICGNRWDLIEPARPPESEVDA
jgi:catechol 2,3-dioxygenase-like lactoylglutathione lyase family enzyme